jgi:hypothetical protein
MSEGWVMTRETYDREIENPVTKEKATVTLRNLSWGDITKTNEIRFSQGEDGEGIGKMLPGENKLLLVELALVRWTLPMEITRDTIRQLNPLVGEQIFRHVNVGEGEEGPDAERANGTGPLASSAPDSERPAALTK